MVPLTNAQIGVYVVLCGLLVGAKGDFIYTGSTYNRTTTYPGTNASCSWPKEATVNGVCPHSASDVSTSGHYVFNLTDPNDIPPTVFVSAAVISFQGIDQTALTYAMTVSLDMQWKDDRGFAQIQNATNTSTTTGKCIRYCDKQTQAGKAGDCCDGIWLPTLKFVGAQPKNWVEEDFQISAISYNSSNYTDYTVQFSAVFNQAFDFTAFPFDRHSLQLRILCLDCIMSRNSPTGSSADVSTFADVFTSSDKKTTVDSKIEGQTVPASTGWQLSDVALAIISVVTSYDNVQERKQQPGSEAVAENDPDFYGMIFIVNASRVTRAFFVLQTIVPPIILVLVGFVAFCIPKTSFVDRVKTLVALEFPMFLSQFTIASILPKTYTLLSCHYLVFVSMILLAMLIGVAAVSHLLVSRQTHVEWRLKMVKGRSKWKTRREKIDPTTKSSDSYTKHQDVENPKLAGQTELSSENSDDGLIESCGYYAKKDKDKEEEKKSEHNAEVDLRAGKASKGFRGTRHVRAWWQALAYNDVEGYREHVALIWEIVALSVCFLIYMASVLAIFLHLDQVGKDPKTL